jgi:hypothetical protein
MMSYDQTEVIRRGLLMIQAVGEKLKGRDRQRLAAYHSDLAGLYGEGCAELIRAGQYPTDVPTYRHQL